MIGFTLSTITVSAQEDYNIPDWVKNNAGWWAEGQIPDSAFVQGIQWLVSNGIIIIDVQETQVIDNLPDYTVLVYMVGSDLESDGYAATTDLREMLEVDLPPSVNVIVQTGGAVAQPDEYRFADFTIVQRWHIDGYDETILMSELGPKNMGVPSTLSDFLIWGTQEFPAKKYALILWDHGSGIHGFGHDEMYDMDETELDEFAVALSSAYQETGVIFEIIGFDQCLMATIEVATVIENYANYMVASEELEPGDGWDYTAILSSLKNNSNQNGKTLGKVIVDSFFEHTKANDSEDGREEQRVITLAVKV